ncbi:MAG: glycosyltransferase [Cetobacterium sp.]
MIDVSVLIPVRNEERYIYELLKSLEKQTYPKEKMEIIVIDGDSEDNTKLEIKKFIKSSNLKIKIIDNQKRTIPIALNLGIDISKGDYIVRLDGHSIYNPEYIEVGINLLKKKQEIVSVGGYLKINPYDKNYKSIVTSKVFSSPFGTGFSKLKINAFTKEKDQYNDTALYGMYRKSELKDINGYNEKLDSTQDIELFDRLKKNFNKKIFLSTKMRIEYYFKPKNGKEIFKRQLRISKWLTKRKTGIRLRHLIPLLAALLGIFLVIINYKILIFVLTFYLGLGGFFYLLEIDEKKQILYTPYACYTFFMNHLGYFIGSTFSILNKLKKES